MNTFSIIIPVKPDGFVAASRHLKQVLTDDACVEILVAEGCAPSHQRNLAAREAVGDVLYFLDDDSLITPENLTLCSNALKDPKVAVVGGPSVTPSGDSTLQRLFGYALSSAFGSGAVCNRYRVYGLPRTTTDKELILCNLAVRRSVFMELGGFNEGLYPNEENEFLDRVQSAGYKLFHLPSMFIYRSQRKTLNAFVRQMFSYGRGRGQQSLVTSSYPVTSFIPLFFLVYLLLALMGIKYVLLLGPLMLYVLLSFASSLLILQKTGSISALFLPIIYLIMHAVNGAGLLWGLVHGKPDPIRDAGIRISKIKALGEPFTVTD